MGIYQTYRIIKCDKGRRMKMLRVKVVDKGNGSGGCRTGRPWDEIVKELVGSGCIMLNQGEIITEIEIDMEYGIYFKLDKLG